MDLLLYPQQQLDIFRRLGRGDAGMAGQEFGDGPIDVAAEQDTVLEDQRIAGERRRVVMAPAASGLESRRGASLSGQHRVDRVDLIGRHAMIAQEQLEVVGVVTAHQPCLAYAQVGAREFSGMAMAIAAAPVPEPMQVETGTLSADR